MFLKSWQKMKRLQFAFIFLKVKHFNYSSQRVENVQNGKSKRWGIKLDFKLYRVFFSPYFAQLCPNCAKSTLFQISLEKRNLKYFLTLENVYESWDILFFKFWKKFYFKRLQNVAWKKIKIFNFDFFSACSFFVQNGEPKKWEIKLGSLFSRFLLNYILEESFSDLKKSVLSAAAFSFSKTIFCCKWIKLVPVFLCPEKFKCFL